MNTFYVLPVVSRISLKSHLQVVKKTETLVLQVLTSSAVYVFVFSGSFTRHPHEGLFAVDFTRGC